MLSVEEISVQYGRVRAVRDVSLLIREGELVTLIGANGAGKTSILNAIAGVVPPSEGRVTWEGQTISGQPAHRVVRLGIGYVPEGRQILGSMSVLDNLALGAFVHCTSSLGRLIGLSGRVLDEEPIKGNLDRVFDLFPILKERKSQRAGSLSGGQQQMLAIGRALMSSPRILLLDEPSIGLAPQVVREILGLLGRLRETGLTVLLVEQDAMAALKIADRGYVLERGRIVVEGHAKELLSSERVRHAYLGKALA